METDQSEEASGSLQQVQILQPSEIITSGETITLQPSEIITSGETITLSLENAAQLILQQGSLGNDEEDQLASGTYQIITQQLGPSSDGQMQVALANGIRVIQATDGTDLSAYGLGGQGIILQTSADGTDSTEMLQVQGRISELDENQSSLSVTGTQLLTTESLEQQKEEGTQEDFDGQSESVLHIDFPVSQSESMLQVINQALPEAAGVQISEIDADSVLSTHPSSYTVSLEQQPEFGVKQEYNDQSDFIIQQEEEKDSPGDDIVTTDYVEDDTQATANENQEATLESSEIIQAKKPQIKADKPMKMPDLSQPIEVKDHMEVVVGGKKCMLKINPETGQLCAYPLITTTPSGKRRGRPKKSEVLAKAMEEDRGEEEEAGEGEIDNTVTEQTNSAAEGLLELSNTGPDGIRRSGRARRKARTLDDYDMIEVSSDDEGAADEAEDEVLPSGAIRKRKPFSRKDIPVPSPMVTPGIKRGRGRPRRYQKPDDIVTTSQIPAMIIPSGDGQTIMMAPIQGLTNLEAFQEQVKNLSIFQQPKTELTDEASQYLNTAGVLSLDDGTQINIQLDPTTDPKISIENVEEDLKSDIKDTTITDTQGSELNDGTEGMIATSLVQTDSINLNSVADHSLKTPASSDGGKATIIQIPENLLPMFTQKKDPVQLGLKASDMHLELLKCRKCGYQAYYDQQYQSHLLTHPEDTYKCKCCNYITFDKEELPSHFKLKHPKCICSVCDHMAEHAYIIKRHMMRHTQDGCTCDICGKVYKDQYVLKMHVKMVHMPAEVLFECPVCSKKFTRKAHLKRHLRIHDPQKPFKCPHCDYRGCERSDISKHLLIHEDPKHICDVCGKTFRHFKNKELHLKRHTGQRDYKCGVCDFYGYTFTDIRKHIERKHSDTKTYLCDKCGAAFKSEQLLREHRTKQCEVFMIEQALSIATSDGGTSQATIQIPSTLSLEGQHLQIDGQNISIDNQGHITVEHVNLSDDGIGLSEDQLQAGVVQGHITDSDLQSVVNQGQMADIGQAQGEMIQAMEGVVEERFPGVGEDDVNLTEEDEEEAEDMDDLDEDEMNERMEDMDDEKQHMVNDHMLGMVHIMR